MSTSNTDTNDSIALFKSNSCVP